MAFCLPLSPTTWQLLKSCVAFSHQLTFTAMLSKVLAALAHSPQLLGKVEFPVCTQGHRGSEMLGDLPKVMVKTVLTPKSSLCSQP